MLEKSFVHLPGIGPETEKQLWSQGLKTWQDLADNANSIFGQLKAQKVTLAIAESQAAQASGRLDYFQGRLKGSEMWRLLPDFINQQKTGEIAYLDIETTGLGFPPESHSTSIAVLFRNELFIEHETTRKRELLHEIESQARLLVTFNGGPFDLPFLRREFNLSLRQAHLDLRFWFARLNLRGGLKSIQKSFREIPQREYMDIDGFDAVRLWRMHENGIAGALDTLMTYNAEDTIVLEQLIYCGLNIESQQRPALNLPIYSLPTAPKIPTSVSDKVYNHLRSR